MKKVEDIIKEWLFLHSYDGLCDPDGDCGCAIDDFAPCGDSMRDCRPAYALECPGHGTFFGPTKDSKCYYCENGEG